MAFSFLEAHHCPGPIGGGHMSPITDNGGKLHQVLSGRPDAGDTKLGLSNLLPEYIFSFLSILPKRWVATAQFCNTVVNV